MVAEPPSLTLVEAERLAAELRATYASGRTRDLDWREAQLDALLRLLTEGEDELLDAMADDFSKPRFEAWFADLKVTAREVEQTRKHFREWARDWGQKTPAAFRPGKSWLHYEPLGVVLVMAPWNYPVQLLVAPMAAALAAGNCVVGKPSDLSPRTSETLLRLAERHLDPDAVRLVTGGVPESTALLEQRWDHIMYTGNGAVGRIVATAAAKHLTPVTLELGGRTPGIVHRDANLALAAGQLATGKFLNSGQTCIAPNHVFVHEDVEEEFLDLVAANVRKRYGKDPSASTELTRIVNTRHAERIAGLLEGGGFESVVCGGDIDISARWIAPTVLRGVSPDAPVMQEEIFGPVLPVLRYADLDEPIAAINAGDKPLALYLFTSSDEVAHRVIDETSSGGVTINEIAMHMLTGEMPFGGVGESGYGAYHGRTGFERFSHTKAVFRRPSRYRDPGLLRPPYKGWKKRVLDRLL